MQRTQIIVTTDAAAVSTQRAGESHICLYRLEGRVGRHFCGHLDSDNMVEEVVDMTDDHMKIVKEAKAVDDICCYQDHQDDFFLCSVQREG